MFYTPINMDVNFTPTIPNFQVCVIS